VSLYKKQSIILSCLYLDFKNHSQVHNTPGSYLEDPRFISWFRNWLSWVSFSWLSSVPCRKLPEYNFKLDQEYLLTNHPELQTESLNSLSSSRSKLISQFQLEKRFHGSDLSILSLFFVFVSHQSIHAEYLGKSIFLHDQDHGSFFGNLLIFPIMKNYLIIFLYLDCEFSWSSVIHHTSKK
jgi:hypothetical protein